MDSGLKVIIALVVMGLIVIFLWIRSLIVSLFNLDQIRLNFEQLRHREYLATLKPEDKCYCGWNELGKCPNKPPYCLPDKNHADKVGSYEEKLT